jgi:hypothetical protein
LQWLRRGHGPFGVNDKGDIVGFFSDGTHVNGFVRFDTPVGTQ